MLNENKILMMAVAGVIAGLSSDVTAQTFYQCMPCPAGTSSLNGSCQRCPSGYYNDSPGNSCKPCPAGTMSLPSATFCEPCGLGYYNPKQGSISCSGCGIGQYSNVKGATSCMNCEDQEFTDKGRTRCININDKNMWVPTATASAGLCYTMKIPTTGLYVVYLRGGKGGDAGSCLGEQYCYYDDDDYVCDTVEVPAGKKGGYVQYKFIATEGTSVELCAGGNGTKATGTAGGGGAGSWIKIGNKYIVAGGGGGGGYVGGQSNDTRGQAGGGGAVGAGGSGDDFSCSAGCAGAGGNVGDYAGAAGQCGRQDGSAGSGINDYNTGKGGRKGGGYGVGGSASGIVLYDGYVTARVGGGGNLEGTATHNSNIDLQLNCSDENTGCAYLYKWKYN